VTVVTLSDRRPPVVYTVTVVQHWNDAVEFKIADVADDARSRASVLDAMQRICGLQEPADAMHGFLLTEIDGLMSAAAGTPEAERLSRLADLVGSYESARFPNISEA
jgi:hypothetical protein